MSEPLRVFVSHASQDKPFADALVRALRGAGAEVWYDEHSLSTGHLIAELTRELTARPIFVIVLSKAAFASPWVKDEMLWAYDLYRREPQRVILPVVAAPIEPSSFVNEWLCLASFRRVEAPGGQPFSPEEAIERTVHLLGLTPPPPGHAATPQVPQPGESVEDLIALGNAKLKGKEDSRKEALTLFERATQLAPRNAAAWERKGYALLFLGRPEEALAAYEQALTLNPNNAESWSDKALILSFFFHRYEEALTAYERAIVLDPKKAEYWSGKGSALKDLGRYEEALVACERATALAPKNALIWGRKVSTLLGLHRYEEALATCEYILALNQGASLLAWPLKAAALRGLGRTAEAEEADRRAEELGFKMPPRQQ